MGDIKPIIVSACLLGEPCRYDGKDVPCPEVVACLEGRMTIPVCPETFGGLPIPRTPSERQPDGRVLDASGADVTKAFELGAGLVVELARELGCEQAILKDKSPSCGVHRIYDGTFTGKLVEGKGIAAAALEASGVRLLSEDDVAHLSQQCS